MCVTLPASADRQSSVKSMTAVQWPVVDDLRIVLASHHGASINVKLNFGELHGDGVVMPLAIANLFKVRQDSKVV